MANTGAQEKTEPKKRLTVGQKMLDSEGFMASANKAADERIGAMDAKKVSKDHQNAIRYSVTLLEVFIGRSPSQMGLDEWFVMESARELVILKRILEHVTAKATA